MGRRWNFQGFTLLTSPQLLLFPQSFLPSIIIVPSSSGPIDFTSGNVALAAAPTATVTAAPAPAPIALPNSSAMASVAVMPAALTQTLSVPSGLTSATQKVGQAVEDGEDVVVESLSTGERSQQQTAGASAGGRDAKRRMVVDEGEGMEEVDVEVEEGGEEEVTRRPVRRGTRRRTVVESEWEDGEKDEGDEDKPRAKKRKARGETSGGGGVEEGGELSDGLGDEEEDIEVLEEDEEEEEDEPEEEIDLDTLMGPDMARIDMVKVSETFGVGEGKSGV